MSYYQTSLIIQEHTITRSNIIDTVYLFIWSGLEMTREAVMSEIAYMFDDPGPVTFDLCSYTSVKDGTLWLEVTELS